MFVTVASSESRETSCTTLIVPYGIVLFNVVVLYGI